MKQQLSLKSTTHVKIKGSFWVTLDRHAILNFDQIKLLQISRLLNDAWLNHVGEYALKRIEKYTAMQGIGNR